MLQFGDLHENIFVNWENDTIDRERPNDSDIQSTEQVPDSMFLDNIPRNGKYPSVFQGSIQRCRLDPRLDDVERINDRPCEGTSDATRQR